MSTENSGIKLIHLYNTIPEPLAGTAQHGNVWNRNLALFRGRHYALKAESGKGKTTFLNMLYGIRRDFRGHVFYDETDTGQMPENQLSHVRASQISYVFQDLRLFPSLSGIENIKVTPGNNVTEAEIGFWADKLEIENQLTKPCSRMSLGQQQRIAILRALSRPFGWMLLDEPFSHLDKRISGVAMELILQRCETNSASIIVTALGDEDYYEPFDKLFL